MKERPIIFSGPMVRAILEGRKTMTRRVVKSQPDHSGEPCECYTSGPCALCGDENGDSICPYGKPGDRLWVRETWADVNTENGPALLYRADQHYHFCVDDDCPVDYSKYPGCQFSMWCGDLLRGCPGHAWRSPIFMPRWASRILLEIVSVRVERLQDISEDDAMKEGCDLDWYAENAGAPNLWPCKMCGGTQVHGALGPNLGATEVECLSCNTSRGMFVGLWEHINGLGSWDANPWVWVVEFKRVEKNK